MFGLTQLIENPTRITFTRSFIIDHILANLHAKVTQRGILNVKLN